MKIRRAVKFRYTISDKRAMNELMLLFEPSAGEENKVIFWSFWRSYSEMRRMRCSPQVAINDLFGEWNDFTQNRLSGNIKSRSKNDRGKKQELGGD